MPVKFLKKSDPKPVVDLPWDDSSPDHCGKLNNALSFKKSCTKKKTKEKDILYNETVIDKIIKDIESAIRYVDGGKPSGMTQHLRRCKKLLRRISDAYEKENKKAISKALHVYFESKSMRLMALCRAAKKKDIKRTAEELEYQAKSLKVRENVEEKIGYRFEEKKNGDYRPLCTFGLLRTAQKYLCKDVLQISYSTLVSSSVGLVDYNLCGGRTAACQRVLDLVHKYGCKYFVVVDIRQCFEHFDHDAVKKELFLPGKVIDNCILIPEEAKLVSNQSNNNNNNTLDTSKVRRGLPQGSLTSNLVAATLLMPVINQVTHHGRIVIYSDGILIGTTSKKEANAMLHALKISLKHSPAGPMYLKDAAVFSLDDGFDFLGYRFQNRPDKFGGDFCARASIASRDKFFKTFIQKCLDAPINAIDEIAEEYLYAWLNSFRLWKMQEGEENHFLMQCYDALEMVKYARETFGENVDKKKFSFGSEGYHYDGVPQYKYSHIV